jgi:hypothetical protein
MMKKIFISGMLLSVFSGILIGQDITFPELQGYRKIMNYPVYYPDNLWDHINGAADGYLALGFVDLNVVEYKKGKNVIKLEIYRHSDHTMTFGIYASERSPSYRFLNLGAQGYITGGVINFFTGNFYVKIRTHSNNSRVLQSAESLAVRVASMLGGDTEMPPLLYQFPDEGKKLNEETYINESVLGHQFLNKAFKASYGAGNENFDIFLMKFNNPEEASTVAQKYLATADIEPLQSDSGKFVFTDGYNGTIFLAWNRDMIVIISGLAKDQSDIADKYTSAILE